MRSDAIGHNDRRRIDSIAGSGRRTIWLLLSGMSSKVISARWSNKSTQDFFQCNYVDLEVSVAVALVAAQVMIAMPVGPAE